MKKYVIVFFILLVAPLFTFAAFDDVTLTTDAVITIDGTNLNVSGSSAEIESITVNATDFTVTLQTGSTFTVSSADRKVIDSSAGGTVTISRTCTGSEATISLSGGSGVTVTLSIGDTCVEATTPAPTTGTGGGGAPGSVSTLRIGTLVPVEPATPPEAAQPSPVAQLVSPVFNRTLRPGISHVDVKRLQQLLNTGADTRLTDTGPGSVGNETSYYGSLTKAAVQKFQAKYGIVSSGTPATTGYGQVGPQTRAKLREIFAQGTSINVLPSTALQSAALQVQIDELNKRVADLLKQLEALQQ